MRFLARSSILVLAVLLASCTDSSAPTSPGQRVGRDLKPSFSLTASGGAYDASLGTLPESQQWSYFNPYGNPAPVVAGGVLTENTTLGQQYWQQFNSSVDFSGDFFLQANLQIISSSFYAGDQPGDTGTREGYYLFVTDAAGLSYVIGLASDGFNINTIETPNHPLAAYPVPVVDGQFHVFLLSVHAGTAVFSVDGVTAASGIVPAIQHADPSSVLFGGAAGISRSLTELKSLCYGIGTAPVGCVQYPFSGFFDPVQNMPTRNIVKAGAAVPMKFSLGGDYGLSIIAARYPVVQAISCDTNAPTNDIELTTTAGSSSLSYDPASTIYNYVWKTDKSWAGTCRQLTLKLNDGSTHQATFYFR